MPIRKKYENYDMNNFLRCQKTEPQSLPLMCEIRMVGLISNSQHRWFGNNFLKSSKICSQIALLNFAFLHVPLFNLSLFRCLSI